MALFWIAAGVLSGAAALMVMLAARRAATAGGEDAALRLHRRQLAEIDELAGRGLLNEADKAAVRAEAGRRLLAAEAGRAVPEHAGSKRSRIIAAAAVLAAAFVALGLYLVFGAPGAPDQPYKTRVEGWRRSDPAVLDSSRLAAVMREVAATRPRRPARFRLPWPGGAGVGRSLRRAESLRPRRRSGPASGAVPGRSRPGAGGRSRRRDAGGGASRPRRRRSRLRQGPRPRSGGAGRPLRPR